MKLPYTLCGLALFLATGLFAQEVQKCCGTSNSTFLLGNISYAKHTQSLYLPGDLSNAQSGTIDRLYFRYGNTGEDLGVTLSDFVIRLGQTTAGGFPSGNIFFTGLEVVQAGPALTIQPGVTGDWFSFPINAFTYDAGQTLILDIWFSASTTVNFGTLGNANNGRKLYANDQASTTGATSSTTWQDFGFDVEPASSIQETLPASFTLLPMPGQQQWELSWAAGNTGLSLLKLHDATGRMLHTEAVDPASGSLVLEMARYGSGVYLLQGRSADGSIYTRRFVKP